MMRYRPAQLAFMHIDVEPFYAAKFGDHWQAIDDCAARLRHAGAAIIGVTYDPARPARQLPPRDPERGQSLIRADLADQCFSKNTVSALGQGAGDGRLRDFVRRLPSFGCRAVVLGGYYADQCVLQTARSLINLGTGMEIVVAGSLCRAYPEHEARFDLPAAMAKLGGAAVELDHQGGEIALRPVMPRTVPRVTRARAKAFSPA